MFGQRLACTQCAGSKQAACGNRLGCKRIACTLLPQRKALHRAAPHCTHNPSPTCARRPLFGGVRGAGAAERHRWVAAVEGRRAAVAAAGPGGARDLAEVSVARGVVGDEACSFVEGVCGHDAARVRAGRSRSVRAYGERCARCSQPVHLDQTSPPAGALGCPLPLLRRRADPATLIRKSRRPACSGSVATLRDDRAIPRSAPS